MKVETTEQQDLVLDAMREIGDWASPKEIAGKSGVNTNSIKSYMERFIKEGIVRKKGRGRYGLVELVGTEETLNQVNAHAPKISHIILTMNGQPWLRIPIQAGPVQPLGDIRVDTDVRSIVVHDPESTPKRDADD